MRQPSLLGTRSSRDALAAASTAAAGALVLLVSFLAGSCTDVYCTRDTGLAFDGVSFSSWAVHWQESCNTCGVSLTPVLVGVALLALGAAWLGASAAHADETAAFDPRE